MSKVYRNIQWLVFAQQAKANGDAFKQTQFDNHNPDYTESFLSVLMDRAAPRRSLWRPFDFMSIKNPQTPLQWTVWPAPLSVHQSAGLFFSFYFQSQAPTQRHSQSLTQPLPKQHGCPTNRSLSICLNIPPTPPPPPPPFPLGYDAIASKWKQKSGRQVGPMLFRSISGLRMVDLRIPIWLENQAEASLVSVSAVKWGSRL